MIDCDYDRLYRDHPEAWDMNYDETRRRFWAYSPLVVASARFQVSITRIVAPIRDFLLSLHR